MTISTILKKLENTSASNEKIKILTANKKNEVLKSVLRYTYNTYVNFYMKKIPTPLKAGKNTIDKSFDSVEKILTVLASRTVTGKRALDMVQDFLGTFNKTSQDIITKILKRDLKIGMSAGTTNKVWKGLIPTFDVALADKYKGKIDIFDGNWRVSRKLDGCRCIAIKENRDIKFYSRNGKEFLTLDVLKEELKKVLADKKTAVLDGEICIVKDGVENFSSVMKEITKKNHTIENPKYYVFDMIPLEDFRNKESKQILNHRLKVMYDVFYYHKKLKYIELLSQHIVTEESFANLQEDVAKNGWEGLILRKNVGYKGKRSKDLLKVKKFFDDEYKVVGIEKGEMTYTEAGKGQVTVETMTRAIIEHKGYAVGVGSGWSREQRETFYKNPNKIIGKTIKVNYFEETTNKQGTVSLRFPTVSYIYENGRTV